MLAKTALDVRIDSKKEPDIEWILRDFRAWISPIALVKSIPEATQWGIHVSLRLVHPDPDVLDALDPVLVEFWMITIGQWKSRRLGDILKEMQRKRITSVSIEAEHYEWKEEAWFEFLLIPFLTYAGFHPTISNARLCVNDVWNI
jgi:hypothetical protein